MNPNTKTSSQGSILGARIRQRRREMGITQSGLATQVGISASYLNLIEWNKRKIAGGLLRQIADALDLGLDELDGQSERRLMESLNEVARLPDLENLGIEETRTGELIGRFPGWARGLASLARSEREAMLRVNTLSDRLTNDPFLNEIVHKMLTRIASIRSATEILHEYPDVDEARRERFTGIVHEEVIALSRVGEALASYLDQAEDSDRVLTPIDEVESFFEQRQNHIPEIEALVDRSETAAPTGQSDTRRANARAAVDKNFSAEIDRLVKTRPHFSTDAARDRAQTALRSYAVSALLMPLQDFQTKAAELRYDIEALATEYAADIDAVCHRLAALPQQDDVPRFGYLQANAAGTITEMLGLDDFSVPRYAAVCPLWILYRAQQHPETVIRQRTLFPSGARFVFVARARKSGSTGFDLPRHYLTDMLIMREEDADHTVYAPGPSVPLEEVGPGCRLCPRNSCPHRAEDPLAG